MKSFSGMSGHVDWLAYLNGRTYIRQFLTWNEGDGYTLRIGEENGLQSFVQWEIDAISENKSQLTITSSISLGGISEGRFLLTVSILD